jgi:hypothetical protein
LFVYVISSSGDFSVQNHRHYSHHIRVIGHGKSIAGAREKVAATSFSEKHPSAVIIIPSLSAYIGIYFFTYK